MTGRGDIWSPCEWCSNAERHDLTGRPLVKWVRKQGKGDEKGDEEEKGRERGEDNERDEEDKHDEEDERSCQPQLVMFLNTNSPVIQSSLAK